jgi:hypothetical protein
MTVFLTFWSFVLQSDATRRVQARAVRRYAARTFRLAKCFKVNTATMTNDDFGCCVIVRRVSRIVVQCSAKERVILRFRSIFVVLIERPVGGNGWTVSVFTL